MGVPTIGTHPEKLVFMRVAGVLQGRLRRAQGRGGDQEQPNRLPWTTEIRFAGDDELAGDDPAHAVADKQHLFVVMQFVLPELLLQVVHDIADAVVA